jgi:hypothetical protein
VTGAVARAQGGWLYDLLVFAHITCAVAGFGAVVYRGLMLDLARRRGAAAAAGVLSVYGQISQIGEMLIYGVAVFGLGAIAAGNDTAYFKKAWVLAAVVVYVLMIGVLHGVVRPAERAYRRTMLELAQMPPVAPPARPPQLAQLDDLYTRVAVGAGMFNVGLLGALYLMVFKP